MTGGGWRAGRGELKRPEITGDFYLFAGTGNSLHRAERTRASQSVSLWTAFEERDRNVGGEFRRRKKRRTEIRRGSGRRMHVSRSVSFNFIRASFTC